MLLHDPLFVRASGGVAPTPKAQRLADVVRNALGLLEQALNESAEFDPVVSRRTFRIHMSDIGEARFLPTVKDTQRDPLLTDRYVVLLRAQHPFALAFNRSRRQPAALLESLHELEFVAVRSHSDTLRILQMLNLESGLRLTTAHSWRCPPSSRLCRCGVSRCRFTRAGASSRTLAIAGCARRW